MDHFDLRDGVLHCEDVPLPLIADAVGTPTYVYSAATMVRHAEVMTDAVAGAGNGEPLVAYAAKANSNAAVLRQLAGVGLGADVVSVGEYRRVRSAGIAPEKIVFSGVGKTEAEMAETLAGGLFQFNVESVEELRMLSAVAAAQGRVARVGLRINPDVEAGTHAKITTGTADNKFGIAYQDALAAYAVARDLPGLKVQGVTMHIGSQLVSLDPLQAAFAKLGALIGALRGDGHAIGVADLGGGLGVPHGDDQPDPASPAAYGEMVRRVTAGWDTRLVFEPGRLIVGNAGVLLTRVIRVKPGARHPWLIVDAAMNDLMRVALYDAWHEMNAVRPSGAQATYNVVGPVCESGDTFAMARTMDRVGAGDLVVFRTAGAYGASMSNNYNSRLLTAEVLVDGGRWALVRRRVDLDDLAGVADPIWR
ncbi:diaminopimelate decarboxylase [Sphingomonas ginkgonis]|uniref:Diaminopimelate decarboxylase n=1 Tax=Sphingomonas ginkgonis TaxID=2315330 RepID=A0A429V6T6_9SPHN|nr:diaminopimelate decarboxylase [Sphingomonas ginkgonis]RST29617.1 diaminopimelate decarboxylase [Sphingomonas ginkgonis]